MTSRKEIRVAQWLEIHHPLVYHYVVIQGTDGDCMLTFGYADRHLSHSLSAEHILLPAFRAERFLERKDRLFLSINAYGKADVTAIIRLCWNESYAKEGFSLYVCGKFVFLCFAFRNGNSLHTVS